MVPGETLVRSLVVVFVLVELVLVLVFELEDAALGATPAARSATLLPKGLKVPQPLTVSSKAKAKGRPSRTDATTGSPGRGCVTC
jgi:hypothetical protein